MKFQNLAPSHYWIIRSLAIILIISLAVPCLGKPVRARDLKTLTVDRLEDDQSLNCISGEPPNCSLRGAVWYANNDPAPDTAYEIILPSGTYDISTNGSLDIYDKIVTITKGTGTTNPVIDAHEVDRVIDYLGDGSLTLEQVVIQNGHLLDTGSDPGGGGAGIRFRGQVGGGTLTLDEVTVQYNTAESTMDEGRGGNLLVWRANLVMHSSSFRYGTACIGGNILFDNSNASYNHSAYIEFSFINHGTATCSHGGGGGMADFNGSDVTVFMSEFAENNAIRGGGYWQGLNGTLLMNTVIIRDNEATGGYLSTYSDGGGLYLDGPTTLGGVTIHGNTSSNLGGGIAIQTNTDVEIGESSIDDNQAAGLGGGISIEGGNGSHRVNIGTSSITNNTGDPGGGMSVGAGTEVWLTNVTLSGNNGNGAGGALHLGSNVPTQIEHVTIADNSATLGCGVYLAPSSIFQTISSILACSTSGNTCYNTGSASIASGGYNLGTDSSCGLTYTGDLPAVANPKLAPLDDYDSPSYTMALKPDSPAIDNANPFGILTIDQRGKPRPVDGDRDGMAYPDIGAYEFQPRWFFLPLIRK